MVCRRTNYGERASQKKYCRNFTRQQDAFVTADDLIPEGLYSPQARYADGGSVFGGGGNDVLSGGSTSLWLLLTAPTYFSQAHLTTHLIVSARTHLP